MVVAKGPARKLPRIPRARDVLEHERHHEALRSHPGDLSGVLRAGTGTMSLSDLPPNGTPLLASMITWALDACFAPAQRGDSCRDSDRSGQ
jgi:hypothetical protein